MDGENVRPRDVPRESYRKGEDEQWARTSEHYSFLRSHLRISSRLRKRRDLGFTCIYVRLRKRVQTSLLLLKFMMTPPRGSHRPLSSMSHLSSPVEEDLAHASAWDDTSTLVSTKSKGKGKQLPDDDNDDDDDDDDNTINGDNSQQRIGEYPPIPEEALESRKVEEVRF